MLPRYHQISSNISKQINQTNLTKINTIKIPTKMKERPNFEKHKISFVQTFLLDASDSLVDGYGSGSV